MILRTDHVAGAAFILFGAAVLAVSGDLPIGTLAFPGSGLMPKLIIGLMMLFGLILIAQAGESQPLASLEWGDLKHGLMVLGITAAAIALYQPLGFILTMILLLLTLLVVVERQRLVWAALYSIAVTLVAYGLFGWALKAPLPQGLLEF